MVTILAEKPSVARDLARVLGATRRCDGYLEGNGYRVTWAVGHLVALAEPAEVNPEWKKWRRELLPMLPAEWPLVVYEKTRDQFAVVKKLLNDRDTESVVCATDAGREGELIFRFIYEAAKCRKPVKRLWISSLTDAAIKEGFRRLRDGREYDGLSDAAKGRSRADWLVGMNLSRAYGLSLDAQLSVGRVQTPTLAMVVERELAIRDFVPETYREVVAAFSPGEPTRYDGTWFRPEPKKDPLAQRKRISDEAEASAIVERVSDRTGPSRGGRDVDLGAAAPVEVSQQLALPGHLREQLLAPRDPTPRTCRSSVRGPRTRCPGRPVDLLRLPCAAATEHEHNAARRRAADG